MKQRLHFALNIGLLAIMLCGVDRISAQSYIPTSRLHQNFVDQSGIACANCSLYSYNAGTTTPTPTYTDLTTGTPNPNPIILDAAGGANIALGANGGLNYKFVLCEGGTPPTLPCIPNGTVQWTVDQIPGVQPSSIATGTAGQIAVYTTTTALGGVTVIPQANGGTGRAIGAVSTGWVIYASSACGPLNSNLLTGGGTDISVCLQNQLNALSTGGGGKLVVDGPALISAATVPGGSSGQTTALQIGPNTALECTNGGGFYLASSSNVWMFGNTLSGNPTTSTYQGQMTVSNCIFNGNGANQSKFEQANAAGFTIGGLWFSGFNGVLLDHVQVWNARTYAFLLANGLNATVNDSGATQLGGFGSGGNNHDGLHLWGTLQNVNVKHFQCISGDDDCLAFNTDEGVFIFNVPDPWQNARFPASGGIISDTQIDDVFLQGQNDALRWIGYTTANGAASVGNITLRNIHGTVVTFGATQSNLIVTTNLSLEIDGWNVQPAGVNGLTVPPGATSLTLKHISPQAAVTVPSGTTSGVELGPTFVANNGVLFSGEGAYNSGAAYALGQFDGTGDFILGSGQPTIQFETGSVLRGQFDASGNFGVGSSVPTSDSFYVGPSGIVHGASYNIGSNAVPVQSTGTQIANQVACIKALGPPVQIGTCNGTVSATTGACGTCQ
jgi:hypothetical protein